jgi:hypothetical protein
MNRTSHKDSNDDNYRQHDKLFQQANKCRSTQECQLVLNRTEPSTSEKFQFKFKKKKRHSHFGVGTVHKRHFRDEQHRNCLFFFFRSNHHVHLCS